tara:strand:+ start:828 stop:1307 length:480 start_codon:yes stop_codon:yes gene_type:complete
LYGHEFESRFTLSDGSNFIGGIVKLTYVKAYFGALFAFCVMDGLWLGFLATDFYFDSLGGLLLKEPNWSSAVIFYLGYIIGIVYFVIKPALFDGNHRTVLRDGALLGLLAYATYDMTNMATLKGWSLTVSMVDMVWGMVITGVSSLAGYSFAASSEKKD